MICAWSSKLINKRHTHTVATGGIRFGLKLSLTPSVIFVLPSRRVFNWGKVCKPCVSEFAWAVVSRCAKFCPVATNLQLNCFFISFFLFGKKEEERGNETWASFYTVCRIRTPVGDKFIAPPWPNYGFCDKYSEGLYHEHHWNRSNPSLWHGDEGRGFTIGFTALADNVHKPCLSWTPVDLGGQI